MARVMTLGTFPATNVPDNGGPVAIAFDGTNMWVVNNTGPTEIGTVTELGPSGAQIGKPQSAGIDPREIAFSGGEARAMFVTAFGSDGVKEIGGGGAASGPAGPGPVGIAFDNEQPNPVMWVTLSGGNSVVELGAGP